MTPEQRMEFMVKVTYCEEARKPKAYMERMTELISFVEHLEYTAASSNTYPAPCSPCRGGDYCDDVCPGPPKPGHPLRKTP